MALYQKLAYAGSIWSLILYTTILVVSIGSYVILYLDASSFLDHNPRSVTYFSSILNIGLSLGVIGTVTSIFVIKSIRKIEPTMIKLGIILIISAIVIVISPYGAFSFYNNIDYPRDVDYNPDPTDLMQQQAWRNRFVSEGIFILGIIPSFFIMLSGIWAFIIYLKSKLQSNRSIKNHTSDQTKIKNDPIIPKASYQKLAYVGSIWSLIGYLFELVIPIGLYVIPYHFISIFYFFNLGSAAYFSSMWHIGLLLGIIGTVTSIIVIKSIRKTKPKMKKLGIILIISAIVIVISPYMAFTSHNNIDYPSDVDHDPYPSDGTQQQDFKNRTAHQGIFILGIIPSFFIMVSGIWVFIIYLKSKNQNYNATA